MGFPVYDFRTDVRNILVTPQIRSRFLRMEPGDVSQSHTHDLGHEIFLILSGRCEFTIDGETEELGPGQMCVALVDQHHSVRVLGDEPMTMYLSVTPHIQPTHTMWTEEGEKEPPRFIPNSAYDLPLDRTTPTEELLDRCLEAVDTLAAAVSVHTQVQHTMAAAFKAALAAGDQAAAEKARNAMWDALSAVYTSNAQLGDVWNEFSSRTVDTGA
jgi:quercetin dioxygenase-like cupin family protein